MARAMEMKTATQKGQTAATRLPGEEKKVGGTKQGSRHVIVSQMRLVVALTEGWREGGR